MSEEKQIFCPQCKTWYPVSHFNSLPLDLRCNKCLPLEVSMAIYDQKVALAGQKVVQLLDAAESGSSLTSLSGIIGGIYDEFGGSHVVCQNVAQWVKDLAATGKKSQALSFFNKLFSAHAKVERTQVEDDWNKLTKAEIETRLALKMASIMARHEMPAAKQEATKKITGELE